MWCWIKKLLGRGCSLPGEGHLAVGAAGHSLLCSGQQQLSVISPSWLPQSCSACRGCLVSQFGMNGMKIPLSPSKFDLRAWPGASLIFRDGKGHRSHLKRKSQPDKEQREDPGQRPHSTGTPGAAAGVLRDSWLEFHEPAFEWAHVQPGVCFASRCAEFIWTHWIFLSTSAFPAWWKPP